MHIKKIETLCEIIHSSMDLGTTYIPLGEYKFFYEDGTTDIKDCILKHELDITRSIEMVEEFSDAIK